MHAQSHKRVKKSEYSGLI